jgi:5,10-methylenetetrahydrofolate reductase
VSRGVAGFRLIYEIEPPREATAAKFLRQLEIFGDIVDAVLIPDNHLGRPALSSVVLAVEARRLGFAPIVALNARDRNHLRLRSDLLTLKAFGVDEVLLLYGDRIDFGRSDLTVRSMLGEEAPDGIRRGVVAPMDKPLAWRSGADFLVTQLGSAGLAAAARLKAAGWSKPLYGGTAALPTREMAVRVIASIPGYEVPDGYLDAFATDPEAGFRSALACLDELLAAGMDGAHLVVPAGRLRFAELLAEWVASHRD